mmetsp:Transcript_16261/g.48711  ORF Transcript_16261/g.48711 Transcript_16261/m.48711 type:complete len:300 (+) Transcript_16261:54-953(+)
MSEPNDDDFVVEHTLGQYREVSAYKIPPRPSAGGYKSGDWRIEDRIFTGRMALVDCGKTAELRLTDASTGEAFCTCPVRSGTSAACVEPAADSSRNFVLRVEDPATRRHAFLGMGFPDRPDALDFKIALADWERRLTVATTGAAKSKAAAQPAVDYSLKDGESIGAVRLVKPSGAFSGVSASGVGSGGGRLLGDLTTSCGLLPPLPPSGSSKKSPPDQAGLGGWTMPPPPSGTVSSSSQISAPSASTAPEQNEEPSNRQSDDDSKTAADIGQLSKDLSATALNQDATTTDVDDEWTAFQ